ncbi:MAG: amidase [Acidimicrobiales bacterium]|jgi:Asp-tRNA(Asn)/Glu-tRNA(Gln) amidotransferase A subunit family amidase
MEPIGVVEAARRVRTGEQSAEDLVRSCLESIERGNPALNAFVHVDADGALAAAAEVDRSVGAGRGDELGPLAGVPFGVKDLEDCIGMPTTRGSRWFADGPAKSSDSIHVARLRGAGAIPIGKTATPELGAWAYTASPLLGVTRNPWDPSRTPGGSSGGSSAAVTSGMVPFATASDGGGSIRTPAAFTGLVGLRATYGRIPTLGDTHLAQNAVVGCVTTSVADTALLLDVMAGPDGRDRTCLPAPPGSYLDALVRPTLPALRVAWSADLGFAVVDPEVAAICGEAARSFAAAIGVELVDRPIALEDYTRIYIGIEGVDRFVNQDRALWEDRLDEADPLCAPAWTYLSRRTLPEAAAVESARRALVLQVADVFDDADLVLTPTTSVAPFAAEGPMPTEIAGIEVHAGMSVALSFLASLVNLPAVSIPAGITGDGLPVGLQVIGPRFREDLVLAAAARYEAARPWPLHCPDRPR